MVAVLSIQPEPDDLWRLTMEHSPVGMAIVSLDGVIVTANVALCDMLGFELDTLRSRQLQDLIHPDDLADDMRMVAQCLAGEIKAYRATKRYIRADGGTAHADLSMALLSAPDGTPIHFIAQVADRTEVTRAMRAKDDFVSHFSHELRTPLTSVMAHLELMEDAGELGPRALGHVTAVRRNVVRLSHFVADVLFTSRAASGCTLVDPYRIDLVTVVAEALDAARVEAAIAGVILEADLPDTLVACVDGIRLRQVVDNLISNATAYLPRNGHVVVALTATPSEVTLVVEDNGEGIDPAELPHVFDAFYRGANAQALQVPGTGLGLHIVRAIAEAHGGTAYVASQPGNGCTVRVTLPI